MFHIKVTDFSRFLSKRQAVSINNPFALENPLDRPGVEGKGGIFGKQDCLFLNKMDIWDMSSVVFTGTISQH